MKGLQVLDELSVIGVTGGLLSPSQFVGSGLVGWYDATTLNLSGGQSIITWPDISGRNNDFGQITAPLRPTFQVNIAKGGTLPIVRCDATDDYMQTSSGVDFQMGTEHSVYVVEARRGSPGFSIDVMVGTADASVETVGWYMNHRPAGSAEQCVSRYGGAVQIVGGAGSADDNLFHVYSTRSDTTRPYQEMRKDALNATNVFAGAHNAGGALTLRAFTTGAMGGAVRGLDFGEILVFNFYLSDAQDAGIRNYLRSKWGTP